jgi:hypothetical protein
LPAHTSSFYSVSLPADVIKKCSSFTAAQWDNYFGNGISAHLWSQVDRNALFGRLLYYQIPSFRSYIAGLEGYHEAIVSLNHQITNDPRLAHKISHIQIDRKMNVKDFIAQEAVKSGAILAKKHEALSRAQQAAIAKQREEVAAAIQKQQELQVTDIVKAQTEDLAAIVDSAKAIKESQSSDKRTSNEKTTLNRAYVIEKTIQEDFGFKTQKHTVLPEAQSLLQSMGHDANNFTQCHGNTLQQHIHDELVTNLNKTAMFHSKYSNNPEVRQILESAVEFTEVGIAYNNAGYVKQAMAISDLVSAITDYGLAVAQGVGDGVTNVTHSVLHPIDTVKNIARTASAVGYHVGKVLYEVADITGTYMVDPVAGTDKFTVCKQNIVALYREISEKYEKLSGPEMVRAATAIATETWLTGKCLGAAKAFYSRAHTKALELATKVEQGVATAPELLASAEGLEVLVANEAAETTALFSVKEGFNEACRSKMLKAAEDMTHYAEEFKKLGLNGISKKDLKHIFKNHVPGGQFATVGNRSVFHDNVQILDLAIEAWAKGTEIIPGEKIFDAGKIIGFAKDGTLTSKVQVCLNGTKDAIRTIYPL